MDTSPPNLRKFRTGWLTRRPWRRWGPPSGWPRCMPAAWPPSCWATRLRPRRRARRRCSSCRPRPSRPPARARPKPPSCCCAPTRWCSTASLRKRWPRWRHCPAPAAPDAVPRLVLLARGDAALALGRADPPAAAAELQRSSEALRSWVALHPADPLAWELLGQIDEALGRRLRAMRAQAEARRAGRPDRRDRPPARGAGRWRAAAAPTTSSRPR